MVTASGPDPEALEDAPQPTVDEVWSWLADIEDPEIPVISIVDLGIVRGVRFENAADGGAWIVTITPTYSGCPATHVIAGSVVEQLARKGLRRVRLETRIAPPWTTDWMTESGKRKLRGYGIAPPLGPAQAQAIPIAAIGHGARPLADSAPAGLECPRCGATDVGLTSLFGSTPCKALYRCNACLEPFEHFKCH